MLPHTSVYVSTFAKEMKIRLRLLLLLAIVAALNSSKGNEEAKLPMGATDLVPDERFDPYKPRELERIEYSKPKIDWSKVRIEYEGAEEFSELHTWTFEPLEDVRKENQKLKERVSELELRVSELEELLTKLERTRR